MTPMPPSLATRLLEARLPGTVGEFLVGDLEEAYRARVETAGSLRANCWYWWETAMVLVRRWPRSATSPSMAAAPWWRGLRGDVRQGLRVGRRAPLFTTLVVLTFALGLGAAGAIFSVLHPVLLQGAPYPDADRLVTINDPDNHGEASNIGYPTFTDVARESRSLEHLAAMSSWTPILGGRGDAVQLSGQRVTHDFFRTLGVQPSLGRDFLPEEDSHAGRNAVVILGHGFWQARFAGDSGIIGRTIQLSDRAVTVIGVMPRSFESLLSRTAMVWAPLGYEEGDGPACRDCRHLRVIARRRASVTPATLQAELLQISTAMVRQFPGNYARAGFVIIPLNALLLRNVRPVLLAITGAVALLLLIACVNVTNLFLGRGLLRSSEFAVRSALGAGSVPLIRQVLVEALLLALAGGILGAGIAYAGVRLLVHLAPPGIPRLDQVTVNGTVLGFLFLLATLCGVIAGTAPAIAARRTNLGGLLRAGGRSIIGRTSRQLRAALVVVEVAVALVLLTGTGLLLRSLDRLLAVPTGFDAPGLVSLPLQTYGSRYAEDATVHQFYARVLDQVRSVPGVSGAAVVSQLPLSGDFDTWGIHTEVKQSINPADDPDGFRYAISPGYLATMGIPLLRGRDITPDDNATAPPVVMINATMARRIFGTADPLEQRLRIGGDQSPLRTVVGITGDTRQQGLDVGPESQIYLPAVQNQFADSRMVLVVRGPRADPALVVPAVREAIAQIDPTVPIASVVTMTEYVQLNAATRRFALVLFQLFGAAALTLAALGLYGVLAASVIERTREIGIRSALGATSGRILGQVARSALRLAGLGVVVGLATSLAGTGLLQSLLFEVSPTDQVTYFAVCGLLLLVSLVAAIVPGWRAVRVAPAVALREE
ncbi:MAG: ADOP family duplicated permease [Gemmatimonadales bacterium]